LKRGSYFKKRKRRKRLVRKKSLFQPADGGIRGRRLRTAIKKLQSGENGETKTPRTKS